jgi:hypothetical protein
MTFKHLWKNVKKCITWDNINDLSLHYGGLVLAMSCDFLFFLMYWKHVQSIRLDHQSKSISFINIDCLGSHIIYQLTLHFVSQFHPSSIWMMIHSCTFISQNKNKSHTTYKDRTPRKHKNTGANDIPWFYFILFFASM